MLEYGVRFRRLTAGPLDVIVRSIFRFPLNLGRAELSSAMSIKFATSGTIPVKEDGEIKTEDVSDLTIHVRVVPRDADGDDSRRKQEWIEIELPGRPERYQPLAQQLASEFAEKLAFFYPGLRIEGGFSEAERVPENDDEAAEIGDKRHVVSVSLREVDGDIPFNREHMRLLPFMSGLERVIRQYTSAEAARNPVDGYLGMFKVIETLYYQGRRRTIEVLKRAQELREVLRTSYRTRRSDDETWLEPDEQSIDSMITDMVKMRDQCAHLRGHNAFGYAPGNVAVFQEVEPLLRIVHWAAREAIRRRIDSRSGGRLPTMYGQKDA